MTVENPKSKLQNPKLKWLILAILVIVVLSLLFRWQGVAQWLWQLSNGGQWLLPLIVASALVDSLNPCAISILLVTIGVVLSLGQLRSQVYLVAGSYIAGIFVVYFLIGIGLLQALHLFNTPHFMGKLGAIVLVILGAHGLISFLFPKVGHALRIPSLIPHKALAPLIEVATVPAAFVVGALVGLCEFPCTGGPYLTAIGLLHDRATVAVGLGYLVLYNIVFVLPLVAIVAVSGNQLVTQTISQWQKTNKKSAKLIGAIGAIVLAIIIWQFS